MSVHERLSVPVGEAGPTWSTAPDARRILVIAHTVTSVTRLLDVLPLFEADFRVQVVVTRARTSIFREGVAEFLADTGFAVLPWDQALEEDFDLAIAASYGDDMHLVRAPLVVLSHGVGYNKRGKGKREKGKGKREKGKGKREKGKGTFGLSAETLIRDGRLVPAVLVLSHPEQLDRVRTACPEALPAALVAGDPSYDRILAGAAWRTAYRRALDAGDRRLVLVSSTWGPGSLLGSRPDLLADLLRELPVDEYRVVLAAHPNVWHGHGAWQLRSWLAECERAGLRVLPPRSGWQAALVAADHVIGDHGSVTAYGASLGTHTMLGAFPHHEVDPDSPIAAFGRAARLLDGRRPLLDQLAQDAAAHTPDRFAAATLLLTGRHGRSGAILRAEFYRRLDLPEPRRPSRVTPPELPSPLPRPWPDSGAFPPLLATAEYEGPELVVRRHPAALFDESARRPDRPHLVVSSDEPNARWRESADVLVHAGPAAPASGPAPSATCPETAARDDIAALLGAHPTVRIAAVRAGRGLVVGDRSGAMVRLTPVDGVGPADPAVLASAAWRVRARSGTLDGTSELAVRIGAARIPVRITPLGSSGGSGPAEPGD